MSHSNPPRLPKYASANRHDFRGLPGCQQCAWYTAFIFSHHKHGVFNGFVSCIYENLHAHCARLNHLQIRPNAACVPISPTQDVGPTPPDPSALDVWGVPCIRRRHPILHKFNVNLIYPPQNADATISSLFGSSDSTTLCSIRRKHDHFRPPHPRATTPLQPCWSVVYRKSHQFQRPKRFCNG